MMELKFSVTGTIVDFPYSHTLRQNFQNFLIKLNHNYVMRN